MIIYGLWADDQPGVIRYVGKTAKNVEWRRQAHVNAAKRGIRDHKCNWIRAVLSAGFEIKATTLATATSCKELDELEHYYIETIPNLTNATQGGEGAPGRVVSVETRLKMSVSQKGRKFTDSHRKALSAARVGNFFVMSEEGRANVRAAWTSERRAKFGASKRGKPLSEAHKLAISLGKLKVS